ncbi:MAG: aminotransferase class V-fold PLP-dependent enzyme [Oscillospiraceae bacterium]|nr:aminotransferase class V-fold PLP-dependent enzyme [Oscillospiraceae bacterium]
MKLNTSLLHFSDAVDSTTGSPLPPVAQVSAFAQESAEQMEQVFAARAPGFAYTRLANPTLSTFERRMAQLEGGAGAVACASGMAAVSMALLNILRAGDEFIAASQLYGGTLSLLHDLEHLDIRACLAPSSSCADIEPLINEKTRLIFVEAISNPGLEVTDIETLAQLAHSRGLPLLVDSTTATPVLLRPLQLGADVVIHSSSKYINGSGSAISGVIVDGGRFPWDAGRWPTLEPYMKIPKLAYIQRLRQDLWQNFGPCLAPKNAFLNVLGLETLGLRVERACKNALALAQALEKLPGMYAVNYPGLESSSSFDLTRRQMAGEMGGALLTFRTGSRERAFALLNRLRCAYIISNVGDVRTLAIHPASSIFHHSSPQEQQAAGVFEDLIRVSVGIEDAEDLIEDFTQAAQAAQSIS